MSLYYIGIILVIFGTINITVDRFVLAQTIQNNNGDSYIAQNISEVIILRLITEVGPITGGIVTIGINFARKQGLKISADAEEYLVKSTKSFVENQSRLIYKEIKNNKDHVKYLKQGIIPDELKKKALQNVKEQMLVEIQSDEFTKTAKDMLKSNIESLVERFVTEHKNDLADKTKNMLKEIIPTAVDSTLLPFKTKEEIIKETEKIISNVLTSVEHVFDYQNMLFSNDIATMYIRSEIHRRVGVV